MTEQKKLMVLGALFVVMLAVGAFQFIPKGSPPAATTEATEADENTVVADAESTDSESTTGDDPVEGEDGAEPGEGEAEVEGLAVNALGEPIDPLNARDPFTQTGFTPEDINPPVEDEKPPVQQTTPPRNPGGSSGSEPLNPGGFDPMPGGWPGGPTGPIETTPIEEPEPTYLVKGVLVGRKPMAVFEDDKGNQRLVPLGGAVDGDTRVVSIERGQVTVERHGKEQILVIQEEARND